MSKLTDKNPLPGAQAVYDLKIHVVDENDPADDPAGSSFNAGLNDFGFAQLQGFATVSLAGEAYTGNLQSSGFVAYIDGGIYLIKPSSESVNSSTLNLNGIGVKPIRKAGNTANSNLLCTLGDMIAGRWYTLLYHSAIDGGGFYLMNPEYPNMIVAEYDFNSDGGAVGTIDLTNDIVPKSSIIDLEAIYIDRLTNFTSAGVDPMISIGFGAGANVDLILSDVPINFDALTQGGLMGRNQHVGSVELTGGAGGSVDTVTINGVDILTGAVAFNTDLATTSVDVANNINGNPNTIMLALAQGDFIYLYRPDYYQFKRSGSQAGQIVGSTSTTITTDNTPLGNKGGLNPTRFFKTSAGFFIPISFTIKNDAITAGKFRVYIPIIPNKQ